MTISTEYYILYFGANNNMQLWNKYGDIPYTQIEILICRDLCSLNIPIKWLNEWSLFNAKWAHF